MSKNKESSGLVHRLTVKVEFGNGDSDLDADHFRVLIDTAVGQLLGVAAPPYSFGGYDERTQKGSILVAQKDLNLFWGALSLYGRHLDERIALHMNSISVLVE
ncbi:oxidoreductaseshort chain dehydrogenase/reductase family protein [Aphelenchoides avenae]|nr:oxidoreductaseshort chain dehydrogenase/reductase family protein [Aphelenchus avenae]